MAKEPEEMLVKYWVSSSCWVEEGGVEVAVGEEHGNACGKDREG